MIKIESEIIRVKLYIFDNTSKLCTWLSRKFNLYELLLEEHFTETFVYKESQGTVLTISEEYPKFCWQVNTNAKTPS
ncbi:hypothetical protein BKI52_35080 [marine bacterium AO1-C]|nr:hypothetical protein BKI52_35080 [marine bacterium AO1-C]